MQKKSVCHIKYTVSSIISVTYQSLYSHTHTHTKPPYSECLLSFSVVFVVLCWVWIFSLDTETLWHFCSFLKRNQSINEHSRNLVLLHVRESCETLVQIQHDVPLASCFLFFMTHHMVRKTHEALSLCTSVWNMWWCTSGWTARESINMKFCFVRSTDVWQRASLISSFKGKKKLEFI